LTDLAEQLGTREHEGLELKRDLSSRDPIRRSICALANDLPGRGAGTLLIGVRDDGTPTGVTVDDDLLLAVASFRDDARILPRPLIGVSAQTFAGKSVVAVDVTATEYPPMRFDGTVYVRVGPSTRKASAGEERQLVERRRAIDLPFDQHAVPGTTSAVLDLELFHSTYLPAAVSAEVLAENERSADEQLASLRLLTPDGTPTVAGVLVLGLDPSAHLSGAYVQFVRYDGSDVDAPVSDQDELRGNLLDQLKDLEARLPANLRHALVAEGLREQEAPDYPLDALREAVVNALVHRSYEPRAPVRVSWFDDRVEIANPGGPFGQVTGENFDRLNDYRNPTLAEAAKNLGYMNRFGRGIARIHLSLERNGNSEPRFEINGAQWSVTLYARTP